MNCPRPRPLPRQLLEFNCRWPLAGGGEVDQRRQGAAAPPPSSFDLVPPLHRGPMHRGPPIRRRGGKGVRRGARDGNVTVPPQMVERGMSIHFPASTCRQPLRGRCPLSGVTPAALSGGRFPTSTARITAAAAVEGRGGKRAHQKPRALSGGRFSTSMAETPPAAPVEGRGGKGGHQKPPA